jgi:hypothetical protein
VRDQGTDLASALVDAKDGDIHMALQTTDEVIQMAIRLCKEHSTKMTQGVEDMWYGVLHELLEVNHDLSNVSGIASSSIQHQVEEHIRGLVSDTLSALVSSSSSQLSFPRLFKRLVDTTQETKGAKSAKGDRQSKGRAYAQFRSILTGMLESYKAESEGLIMTTRLVNLDLFTTVRELKVKRETGWRPKFGLTCAICGQTAGAGADVKQEEAERRKGMRVMGDGRIVHPACREKEDRKAAS